MNKEPNISIEGVLLDVSVHVMSVDEAMREIRKHLSTHNDSLMRDMEGMKMSGECDCGSHINNLGAWHSPRCSSVAYQDHDSVIDKILTLLSNEI